MRFSAASTADRLLPQRLALRAKPFLGRFDAVLLAPDAKGEAGRISLIAFTIRIVSAVIALVSQVFLARWMGSFEYGIFVLAWTTMIIVGNLSCLGFHTTVIRFIPEYRERGLLAELRGILFTSRLFVGSASTAIAAAGALGIWLFSDAIEIYYLVPFALGIICLPMIALSDLLQGIARANAWALAALSPTYIIRPVLILSLMGLALALGYDAHAKTAMLAAIAAAYATTLWQLASVTARIDARLPVGGRRILFRRWFAVSLPIFLVESFFFLLTNADVLMVGIFMRPEDVAVYYATGKTLALVHFVYFAVKAGVAQRYAAFTHADPRHLASFARETVAWTFWPSALMALVVLALGKPILGLFGAEFVDGFPLLFLLVSGVVARAAVGPCESLLTMSGHHNVCALVYALTLAFNVTLSVLLIPLAGLWGAALATGASMIFEAAALSFTAWRKLGIVMAIFIPVPHQKGAI